MGKKKFITSDRAFQKLAATVNNAIIKNDGLIGDQKAQVELVTSLERKFKFYIQKYKKCHNIYLKFIHFIIHENRNILSARPYFREIADEFSAKVTPAIRENNIQELMKFDINFQFINFIAKHWNGAFPSKAQRYYVEFLKARQILIENNIPLAINRAKLFYRKTPRSHLSLLDLIDICIAGLISGTDKYAGPYTKVWRSVCIGRMVGNMIEEYSKTFLRLYPTDKKILYRANSLRFRLKLENNITELTKAVNKSFEQDRIDGKKTPKLPISEVYLRNLLNGVGYISADSKTKSTEESEGISIYDYTPHPQEDVEAQVIKKDLLNKVIRAAQDLEIIEKKIIMLKGVDL
jgi:DNA-directed RNA polymerase specialized sigma subunit